MKRNVVVASIFYTIILSILLLNSFVSSILSYWNLAVFLIIILIAFKMLFGFEKDNHRYTKDIFFSILIIILISSIVYYLSGLFIGFVRSNTQYSFYGITNFLLPITIILFVKEFLRYQMINKFQDTKVLIVVTVIFFSLFDITNSINYSSWNSNYQGFLVFALYVFPAISRNVVASYIAYKVGCKPNILWIGVITLYSALLPIVPNTGEYMLSLIRLLLPIVIGYSVYSFFSKRKREVPLSYIKNRTWALVCSIVVFVLLIVYFTSGYFKYYSIAIATGSMTPNIYKGDVVVIDQKYPTYDLKVGDIIAYKYESKIIVHRINKIAYYKEEKIYYTKGDANNSVDEYIVYPEYIMGIVKLRIPYIGLPTVWLNEL